MDRMIFTPYERAAQLLQDERLVWSSDIDSIRQPLALCLSECAVQQNLHPYMLEIAYRLISEEHQVA